MMNKLHFLLLVFPLLFTSLADAEPVAAKVFGQDVTVVEITPSESMVEEYQKVLPDRPKAEVVLDYQVDALRGRIVRPLLDRFSKSHNVEPTDSEITSYVEFSNRLHQAHPELNFDIDPEHKLPKSEIDKIEKKVARDVVRNWKLSKALFETYGGAVIFQQGNPMEPVGAMRSLLEQSESKGEFQIFDQRLLNRFWEYFRGNKHSFVPPSDIDYSKPWWERSEAQNETPNVK